ncbi:MAG TPA: ABC transporter ATP-binding protein, partial [Vicinamibacterales bacterium]|nr:ABC transporter ATP-binding protein [Vicinamibacterales bacterium]
MIAWLRQLAELGTILRHLRPHFAAQPILSLAVLGISLFVMVFEGLGVGLLVPLLNLLLGGESAAPMRPIQWLERTLPGYSPAFYIGAICIAIVMAIAAKNIAFYTSQALAAALKRRISVCLRDRLFHRLQQADLDVFDRAPGGELANLFLVESDRTTMAIDALLAIVQRTSVALFYLGALFYLSWPLTVLVLGLTAALGGALSFVYHRLMHAGVELTDLNNQIAAALTQSFAGIRTIRATNSQDREVEQFHRLNVAQAVADERSAHASSLLFPLTETLAVTGGMAIVACAYVFLVRPGAMLSSHLLAYGFVLLRLLPLLNQLWGLQGHLFYLAGGIREVQLWLDTPVYPRRPFGQIPFEGLRQELRFELVSFRYPNGALALDDVSFRAGVGQTVGIVGPSGSGKSTIAALLLRLRAPTSGCIVVDGKDYWDLCARDWHKAVALVEQDAFLFHGTLRENVVYGCEGVGETELHRALATANLLEVVAALPAGLDTLV